MKRLNLNTMSIYRYPFYIMRHPSDGFFEMKVNKKSSGKVAAIIVSLWILVEVLYRTMSSYDVNPFVFEDVSFLKTAIISFIMYAMVCVANWCFCSLLDGKGKIKEIFIVIAYALLPYVICRFGWVLLSDFFNIDEQILFSYCVTLSGIWSFIIGFFGLKEIHEYSMKKNILAILLTALGVILMMFIGLLFMMLLQSLYIFIVTVVFEALY